jgi:DNA-binding response OmpR family regulator
MPELPPYSAVDFDTHFKVFHELMSIKVLEILLVASPYNAYILEEDGSLASKIINEYRGLNLSRPPRITRVTSAKEALYALKKETFDLVLVMPHLDDMDTFAFGQAVKSKHPELPVIMLAHSLEGLDLSLAGRDMGGIDQVFIWSGDADILLAIVKSVEDRLNVERDTKLAMARVLLLVEDSPLYRSYFLPLIYKAVVQQTQKVLDESLNEEHRLLKMRARPKILVAENFEQAISLLDQYKEYLFGAISDTRFTKKDRMVETAGVELLGRIKQEIPDLPVLLLSTESCNRKLAATIPAVFLDKNSPNLVDEIKEFFLNYLGFGDFVFRDKNGHEIGRASNLRTLEKILADIPDEPLCYHAQRNRFSNWIMARSEIGPASILRKVKISDFKNVASLRQFIIKSIHTLRKRRQLGVVVQYSAKNFDPDISDFMKIGQGSLGGKARGLAFVAHLLRQSPEFLKKYSDIDILVPYTLVITTHEFDEFLRENEFGSLAVDRLSDNEIKQRFLKAELSQKIHEDLTGFIEKVNHPLSIRSSSLLEDAHCHPFSGLYKTYMIPNNDPDFSTRLTQLITAIKLVYASTYYSEPRTFRDSIASQIRKESMAIIIQQVSGQRYGDYFYPAVSGIAQSQNYYPFRQLKPEDGVARISLGFGSAVLNGTQSLRFCPKFPNVLPQYTRIEDILENAQRNFYALKMTSDLGDVASDTGLKPRNVDSATDEWPVRYLSSVYIPEENRLRDAFHLNGPRVLTFNNILKYNLFPLAQLLSDLLELGRKGLGCPVEFEFSVDLTSDSKRKHRFHILQVKPMSASTTYFNLEITQTEMDTALCFSTLSMGNGIRRDIKDIVYIKPDRFDPSKTRIIAREIGRINAELFSRKRPYLIIGPGRWGSFDPFLGIPVKWTEICGAGTIVELRNTQISADPSHGTHFFHQLTSRGLFYITITEDKAGFVRWRLLEKLSCASQSRYLCHVRLPDFLTIKCDGRTSRCVVLKN